MDFIYPWLHLGFLKSTKILAGYPMVAMLQCGHRFISVNVIRMVAETALSF